MRRCEVHELVRRFCCGELAAELCDLEKIVDVSIDLGSISLDRKSGHQCAMKASGPVGCVQKALELAWVERSQYGSSRD